MKILNIITILFISLTFITCSDKEDNPPPKLEIEESYVNFSQSSSKRSIEVNTNVSNWSVLITTDAQNWLSATKENGVLIFTVKENTEMDERSTDVTVIASNLKKIIKVTQMGLSSSVLLEKPIINIDGKEQTFKQVITSKEKVEVEIADDASWLILKDNYIDENENQVFVFSVTTNSNTSRSTQVKVVTNGSEAGTFTVNQAMDDGYTGAGADDVLSDIKIKVLSASTTSYQPNNGNIENSFDGDYSTLYHSAWNNSAGNYFPITLEYRLEQTNQLDYIIYYPRSKGSNGNFKEVDIYASSKNDRSMKLIKTVDFKGSNSPKKIILDNPIINPYAVRFVVKSGSGSGQGFASAAEIEFYQINPDNYNPLQVFKDYSISELKDGVTLEDIESINNELYKNIAYRLFKNEYPSEFRVQEYRAWANPNEMSSILKSNTYSLLDNPTGIYVEDNDVLIVGVDDTYGNDISIKIQNLDKPGGDGYGQASYHELSKGINKIENHEKGLIYVLYHTPNYLNAPKVKIHFATGRVNGYYDSQKHSNDDWSRLLNAATYKYFDVLGDKAHLTFETDDFRTYASENGFDLINQYDKLVRQEQDFMGFYKYNKVPKNRAYFHVMYHSYMYSTSYRTAYNKSTVNTILNYETFKKNLWGPAHELGHTHQISPAFKWAGMTEVTTNVFSEYIQTKWLGYNNSRLDIENIEGYNNRYEKGFIHAFVNNVTHAQLSDPFVRLIPLWQLQLIMAEVENKKDFYKDLFEVLRTTPNPSTSGEAQLNFLLRVIEVSKIDLTEFFKSWGLLTPIDIEIDDYGVSQFNITQNMIDNLIQKIEKYNYPKANQAYKYITDSNFEIIKNKQAIQKGTFRASGNSLIFSNWKNVVAFEVYNSSDKLIFASPKSTFQLEQNFSDDMKVYAISGDGSKLLVN